MTTATLTRPRILLSAGAPRRGLVLGFFGTLAIGLGLLAGVSLGIGTAHEGRIMPGVQVAGVEVAGLDRDAAIARLGAQLPSLSSGHATVMVGKARITVSYGEIGRAYAVEAMVDEAMGVARSGNPFADAVARLRSVVHATPVAASVQALDEAALNRAASAIADRFTHEPIDATVRLDPAHGFVAIAGHDGSRLRAGAVRGALASAISTIGSADPTVTFSPSSIKPSVSNAQAEAAALAAQRMTSSPLRLDLPGAGDPRLSVDRLQSLVRFGAERGGTYEASVDRKRLLAQLRLIAERVDRAPQNASYLFGDAGVTTVVPAVAGRQLDVVATARSVGDVLEARAAGGTALSMQAVTSTTQPALSTEEARAAIPRFRRLGTWTTYYVPGEGNFWGANISIPAHDLDGKVIAPGEWFEFWQGIGPVTLARGYGYGGAIIGGRSVPNGALAGGICSTSTTLFNAAMRAGLEIGERTNHSYYIDRYPVGLDATVLKTDDYETDVTFRNDMANPIVIRSYTGTGWVRFEIWGVADGRTVSLSDPVTSNHGTAIWTTVVNPDLAPGTSIIREYPHDGFDAVVTRWVRDADGNLLHEDTWHSHYRTVNGITEVGPRRTSGDN